MSRRLPPPAARPPDVIARPMLATAHAGEAPAGPAWTYEPKYDGIRAVAIVAPDVVRLVSRNGIDKRAQFPEVAEALAALARAAGPLREPIILDGEIVALDARGDPAGFQSLQGRMHATRGVARHRESAPAAYVAFDCLADGSAIGGVGDVPLVDCPWRHRRKRLEGLLRRAARRAARETAALRLGESSPDLPAMQARAEAEGWEGLIAKRVGAPYRAGERSRDWLKLKREGRQELVIGGWTDPEGSRQGFGALLVGHRDASGRLRYAGRVGTGFTHAMLRTLRARLDALAADAPPFDDVPAAHRRGAHWVRPTLVAEVKFTEWTRDGLLRHPSFVGLRDDRDARTVTREPLRKAERTPPRPALLRDDDAGRRAPARPASDVLGPAPLRLLTRLAEIEAAPRGAGALALPGGISLALTNLGRVVLPARRRPPAPAVTKGDLLRYYARVAPVLLPAIADRPLVLRRFVARAGGAAEAFYQQHAGAGTPPGVRTEVLSGDPEPRFVAGDLPTLLHVVQLGAVSIDPWHARAGSLETPDYTIIDLDPGPGVKFTAVVDCARRVLDELDRLGLHAVPKTSGASGLHVVVPLPRGVSWDAARLLAELVATRVARAHPRRATVVRSVRARPAGTIYVDYLQNVRGKSVAAVYSARAEPGATVSTPLHREEVVPGLDRRDFTIASVPTRLAALGDLWSAAMRRGNSLDPLLEATEATS